MVKPPKILKTLFHNVIWNIPVAEKTLFLTFDDGPIPETTPEILKILNTYSAKATFFCVGENVKKYSSLYYEIKEQGHSVGNHTFNHVVGWKTQFADYIKNIKSAQTIIKSDLFRPPHGKISLSQKQWVQREFHLIMWEVLSKDYDPNLSPDECFDNIVKNAKPGSIIVLHDSIKSKKNTLNILPRVLDYYNSLGYDFKPITSGLCNKKQRNRLMNESIQNYN